MKCKLRNSTKTFSYGGVKFNYNCLRKDMRQKDPQGRTQLTESEFKRYALMAQQDFLLGV